jgi:hypothetical protein
VRLGKSLAILKTGQTPISVLRKCAEKLDTKIELSSEYLNLNIVCQCFPVSKHKSEFENLLHCSHRRPNSVWHLQLDFVIEYKLKSVCFRVLCQTLLGV